MLTEWSTRLVVSNLVAVRAVVLLVDGTVALVGSVVVVGVLLVRSVHAGSIAVESSITATSLASNRLVLAINTVESIKSTNLAVGLDVATATNTTEVLSVTALVLVETLDSLNVTEVSDSASLTGVKLGLVGLMLLLFEVMGEVKFTDTLASIESLKTMSLGGVMATLEALETLSRAETSEALESLGALTSEALKLLGTLTSEAFDLGALTSEGSLKLRKRRASIEALKTIIAEFKAVTGIEAVQTVEAADSTGGESTELRSLELGNTEAGLVASRSVVDSGRSVRSSSVVDASGSIGSGGAVTIRGTIGSGGVVTIRRAVRSGGVVAVIAEVGSGGVVAVIAEVGSGGVVAVITEVRSGGVVSFSGTVGSSSVVDSRRSVGSCTVVTVERLSLGGSSDSGKDGSNSEFHDFYDVLFITEEAALNTDLMCPFNGKFIFFVVKMLLYSYVLVS